MAFNVPINSIAPIPTPSNWVRPSDWIAITDTANEVQFLVADTGFKAFTITTVFTRVTAGHNIYIDWGDGVINTITILGSTDTSHVYSTGGTPCSRGYNTFKIRIYGDATSVITNAQHLPNFSITGGNSFYNIGLLEAYYGNGTCSGTSFAQSFYSNNINVGYSTYNLLEYVKFPATVTWTAVLSSMFRECKNLYVVIMPTSAASLSTINNGFTNCSNLLDIQLPSNSTLINDLGNMFSGCTNLRTVLFPTTLNECTTFSSTFSNCYSLKNVTLPSINKATNLLNTFQNCLSLQWMKFTSLPAPISPSTVVTLSPFTGCRSLQNIYLPSTCSTNAIYDLGSFVSNCVNLKNIVFPTNLNASTMSSAFASCSSITSITLPTSMPNLTDLTSAFVNNFLLRDITLPSTIGSSISLSSTFNSCISLLSIVIPSGWILSNLSNTFASCSNITSITLPNNAQNSITVMNNVFTSCTKLQTIVMPTSLNLVNTLANTFANCTLLTSVTFPSTMNAVTTASACFSGCNELKTVTLPTSMTACTTFASMFASCYNIKSITMPATVSASTTTYGTLVQYCSSLQTLILPTTQTSLNVGMSSMFTGCGYLTSITNLNKVGSLTTTPLVLAAIVQGSGTWANNITTLSFNCPFSQLTLNGSSITQNFNKLNSLRLLNASAGQWTGASPQINVSFCDLSTAALNTLFADMAAQGVVTSKTINITSATGAAGLTAADRLIVTSKGWTITG